ncbi:MAG: NUDIX domain-containing protein [Clostridia bacterium]|nr:NUDIX domain-containing protein [Clostridia bacterium]
MSLSSLVHGGDLILPAGEGYVNIRVGAIILRGGQFLMAGNSGTDYLYSVGGRVKLGESTEDAVVREVLEETGVRMEIDRLGFVHEAFFAGDNGKTLGKVIYELAFYYYMKVPEVFEPVCESCAYDGKREFLEWVSFDSDRKYFPEFFRSELCAPSREVKHFITREI